MIRRVLPRVLTRLLGNPHGNAALLNNRQQLQPSVSIQVRSQMHSLPKFSDGADPLRKISNAHERFFSRDANANGKVQANSSAPEEPQKRSTKEDIKEYQQLASKGSTAMFDTSLIAPENANVFPRIKTTSLSTKRIVIHDEALSNSVTLVMVAFRSFADDQLQSWRRAFEAEIPQDKAQWYDVTINESFGAQALSGFIQRLQRGRTDPALHDYYVAFNNKAREPLEALLPSRNRMFGYVLLLDAQSRVRFRASGMASDDALQIFLTCAKNIVRESASP